MLSQWDNHGIKWGLSDYPNLKWDNMHDNFYDTHMEVFIIDILVSEMSLGLPQARNKMDDFH